MASSEPLHVKYRPRTFEEVIGQKAAVAALQQLIKRKASRSYLFSGPSGVGKTTLARITARALGCKDDDVLEIDAATHTGVEGMRSVQEILRYKPFGDGTVKAVIVDECHGLSRQSWESLLKSIEEPPEHVVWLFCTTQMTKVPQTIRTRCAVISLKAVSSNDLLDLFDAVCDEERIDLNDDVADVVVEQAMGSPRQMLVNLALCRNVKRRKEASELLRGAAESDPALELCRYLIKGGSWMKAKAILTKLEGEAPEGVRIQVCNYLASVIRGANSDKAAGSAMQILQEFSEPYNSAEGMAPLYLSIGRVLFNR